MKNPNELQETEDVEAGELCTNCGMPSNEWSGPGGQGYKKRDQLYCCEGCADGTGCTCAEAASAGQPASMDRASGLSGLPTSGKK